MKKLFVGLLSIVLLLASVGCGEQNTTSQETASTTTETITVVTAGNGLPYSLLEGDDTWTGIDADMWDQIKERSEFNIEVKKAAFDAIFGELDSERADVAANCLAEKTERADKYYMSMPYYGDAQCIAVSGDNTEITDFSDLKGKRVGASNGQASQTILEEMAEEYGFEVVMYETISTGYSDVALGRLDAMGGPVTGVNQFNNTATNKIKIMDEKLRANNVVYYFSKTEAGAKVRDEVNDILQKMLDDGTCGEITKKWLFEDMTSYIQPTT